MHERSLAALLIEQVDEERHVRRLGELVAVRVALGEFSGVEPALFAKAFAELSQERWRRDVALRLEVTPLAARCRGCAVEFRVERFRFVCPACENTSVDVVSGEEVQLVSLSAERSTSTEEAAR
jgi:hydrogenase nickel incorporation protein HypA/HybF